MIRIAIVTILLAAAAAAGKVAYSYDAAGRLSKVDYGDGRSIVYSYDKAGNLIRRAIRGSAPPTAAKKVAEKKPLSSGQR